MQLSDDLSRNVYCMLGAPIDAVSMAESVRLMEAAKDERRPFLVSTPNLNFLVIGLADRRFRQTLIFSDLCPPDGMSLLWIARLIGIPLKERVAGSDMLEAMREMRDPGRPLKIFLFGGAEGVAEKACSAISRQAGLTCVGVLNPGFGTVDQMSSDEIIQRVNASGADFLLVALGATKGQSWLYRNHAALVAPVRAHLGAVINFYAGTVRRAPAGWRRLGFEWLWRIREEPNLWNRYVRDGAVLIRLMATRIMPLALWSVWLRVWAGSAARDLRVERSREDEFTVISLIGSLTEPHAHKAITAFVTAIEAKRCIVLDLAGVISIDARCAGILLMLRKVTEKAVLKVRYRNISPRLSLLLRLYGVETA